MIRNLFNSNNSELMEQIYTYLLFFISISLIGFINTGISALNILSD